jgi:hypothetical protein
VAAKKKKEWKIVEKKLGRELAVGMTEKGSFVVYIDPRLKAFERLDTTVHEGAHNLFPEIEEDYIEERSTRLAELLWKDGWRRIQE